MYTVSDQIDEKKSASPTRRKGAIITGE